MPSQALTKEEIQSRINDQFPTLVGLSDDQLLLEVGPDSDIDMILGRAGAEPGPKVREFVCNPNNRKAIETALTSTNSILDLVILLMSQYGITVHLPRELIMVAVLAVRLGLDKYCQNPQVNPS
jgi:hypothetical protein